MEHKLLRIPTGGRLTSWLFAQRSRRVELGTTEEQIQIAVGFEPGTSRFQIQRPKPLGHVVDFAELFASTSLYLLSRSRGYHIFVRCIFTDCRSFTFEKAIYLFIK